MGPGRKLPCGGVWETPLYRGPLAPASPPQGRGLAKARAGKRSPGTPSAPRPPCSPLSAPRTSPLGPPCRLQLCTPKSGPHPTPPHTLLPPHPLPTSPRQAPEALPVLRVIGEGHAWPGGVELPQGWGSGSPRPPLHPQCPAPSQRSGCDTDVNPLRGVQPRRHHVLCDLTAPLRPACAHRLAVTTLPSRSASPS